MAALTQESGTAYSKTATGNVVLTTDCTLLGFYVNNTSSGTMTLKRGGSGGTAISGTITPAIGFHRFPASCPGGLYFTLASGSLDVTFFVIEGIA